MATTDAIVKPGGQFIPGSFGGWLSVAKPGAVYWTDRRMQSLTNDVKNSGRTVEMKRFHAVSDTLEAARLTRVTVIA